MANTASKVIERVRIILTDDAEPHRWSDPTLFLHLADARTDLFRLRPDAFYVSEIISVLPPFGGFASSDLGVTDPYVAALAYFVASKCIGQDAEHASNVAMASALMAEYMKAIS